MSLKIVSPLQILNTQENLIFYKEAVIVVQVNNKTLCVHARGKNTEEALQSLDNKLLNIGSECISTVTTVTTHKQDGAEKQKPQHTGSGWTLEENYTSEKESEEGRADQGKRQVQVGEKGETESEEGLQSKSYKKTG